MGARERARGAIPGGREKLLFNPSLAGGSSQETTPHIRGAFSGIDLGHTQEDVIRSCMEGVAMNLALALDVLRKFQRGLARRWSWRRREQKQALAPDFRRLLRHDGREDQRRPGRRLPGGGGRGGGGLGALEGLREDRRKVHKVEDAAQTVSGKRGRSTESSGPLSNT